jgi:NDP-mannose synthase
MQAIILAGGKGTRLKPYTTVFPKPLMPIGDIPILEVIVKQLISAGFTDIVFTVGHLKELLHAYFGDGSKWGGCISYSAEDKPLGTAGPLTLIEKVDDNFIVMNGDVLTDIDYLDFFNFHVQKKQLCTIATYKKEVKIDLGVLEADNEGYVNKYIEKPTLHYDVSMGVYAFNKKILQFLPKNQYYDFPTLIQDLIRQGRKVNTYAFDGYWLDIGRPDDYNTAVEIFEKDTGRFIK